MPRLLHSRTILIGILMLCLLSPNVAKPRWTLEPISVDMYSSDESKLKIQLKMDRISRGVYSVSGSINWNYDVGDDTMIEVLTYRSRTGNEADYVLMPWSVPKQHVYQIMDTYYKEFLIPSFRNCSNMPVFKGHFEPPWQKQVLTFNRCTCDGNGLPEIVPEGFYKVVGTFTGEVNWGVQFISSVETKIF